MLGDDASASWSSSPSDNFDAVRQDHQDHQESHAIDDTEATTTNHDVVDMLKTLRVPQETLKEQKNLFIDYLRREREAITVDSAIAQRHLERLSRASQCILISVGAIGIVNQLFQIVADIVLVNPGTSNHSSTLFDTTTNLSYLLPPALLNALMTVLAIVLKQLSIAERLTELTIVKRDADYVSTKLQMMANEADRCRSEQDLLVLVAQHDGELSDLQSGTRCKLSMVLPHESRVKHKRVYQAHMLEELDANQQYETLRQQILAPHNVPDRDLELAQTITARIEEFRKQAEKKQQEKRSQTCWRKFTLFCCTP